MITISEWWALASAGDPRRTPRQIDQPQPGYYKTKRVRGGPWVPARIWIDDAEQIQCKRDGEMVDALEAWPFLRPITIRQFAKLTAAARHDAKTPVDLTKEPAKP